MRKSWSPWTTFGYEVKVGRSDFVGDRKWEAYTPFCHEFAFVCPAKLIAVEELPPGVGLLWHHGGDRLTTRRKAVRGHPDPIKLLELMSYVLMSRTQIVANMWRAQEAEDRRDQWAQWLARDTGEQWLGHMVSSRLAERVHNAERKAAAADSRAARYETVRALLERLGLDAEYADAATITAQLTPRTGLSQRSIQLVSALHSELQKELLRVAGHDA
jgi:hypothetical protein